MKVVKFSSLLTSLIHFLSIYTVYTFVFRQLSILFYLESLVYSLTTSPLSPPDFRLHVSLFYREALVKKVTTSGPEGCQITSYSSSSSSSSSPSSTCPEDKLYSGAEVVLFPSPYPESQRRGAEKLPNVLERGVLLWMASDGLYAKRLCQSRVYWEGPLAPYTDKPNKLEKEQTCKLFDTQQFLTGEKQYFDCELMMVLNIDDGGEDTYCRM